MLKRGLLIAVVLMMFVCAPLSYAKKTKTTTQHKPALPTYINPPGEKIIIVDPSLHEWGAYSPDGTLLRSGIATAGSSWCRDLRRPCRTKIGSFRVYSLGSRGCKSSKFPMPRGGAPMPYCMFFNGGQALHGSAPGNVVRANLSHGCVRLKIPDAEWLRFNFVEGPSAQNGFRGTRVVIRPY